MEKSITSQKKALISAAAGSAIEFYDFTLYGYFAPIISKLFFPESNSYVALIYTFGIFALGYMVRPVGGIIFSHFADKIGRKKALTASLLIMALSTFSLSIIPTYQTIGVMAPIILILIRLVQGISVSGEVTSSIVFLAEYASAKNRGAVSAYVFFGVSIGMLLASCISIILAHILSDHALSQWGWRVAFLFGVIIGVIGIYIRTKLDETFPFQELKKSGNVLKAPMIDAIKNNSKSIFITFITAAFTSSAFYTIFIYMPTYLTLAAHRTHFASIAMTSVGLLIYSASLLFFAALSDRIGRKKIILWSCVLLIVFPYPLFLAITAHNIIMALFAQIFLSILVAACVGAMPAFWTEQFPTKNRTSGFSIGYNISVAIFGGLSPLFAIWLTKVTGNPQSVSFLLIFLALITFIVIKKLTQENVFFLDRD